MIFRSYRPSFLLLTYVDVIHLRHFVFPPHGNLPFKPYPPRPEHCLTFYVRGVETTEYKKEGTRIKRPRSTVSGQYISQINRNISSEFLMILVVFKPGALNRLTGIPFTEFTNLAFDAESVFGYAVRNLNERLNSTDSYDEMIDLVNTFLVDMVKKSAKDFLPVDHAINYFVQNPASASVKNLSSLSCLSPRQVERRFLERVGINPKTFLRIIRFNRSYFLHLRHPAMNWSSLAIHCGFTDYQHMVKDYIEFTGSTPELLFLSEANAPERILGLTH